MSRDNIIGLLLIFVILIGFSILNAPSEEQKLEAQRVRDSIANARQEQQQQIREAEAMALEAQQQNPEIASELAPELANDSVINNQLRDRLGYFATAAVGQHQPITIETELLRLVFSNKGGFLESVELRKFKTWDQQPLYLYKGDNNIFNLQFYSANRLISTRELYFKAYVDGREITGEDPIVLQGDQNRTLALRLYPDNPGGVQRQSYLEFLYTLPANDYMLGFTINTVGMSEVIAANSSFLNLDWQKSVRRLEKSRKNELNTSTVYYKFLGKDIDRLRETRDGTERLTAGVRWISFKQQFFSSVIIAQESFSSAVVSTQSYEETNEELLKRMSASIDIPYNSRENNSFAMQLYFGPNHFNTLKSYGLELEKMIPLGWAIFGWINRLIVIPVFNYLDGFNLSYGIIILILTLMLKMVLFPISYKTYLSSARMRVLKPDIDALNEKYPKKEDAMKKQQAVMALYKKAGVNPMAGCVPMLLQFPFLIAMFRFFPASFELRQEAFLWADDLSTYDSILELPFTIPWYGDHVSLFTLLMTASTIIYTRMNSQMMNTGTQMPGMKTMLYFMPVMLLFIFNSFASGLSYYYFLANVITFGQMYAFRFMINEDKIRLKIEENKKKPVKKSSWQKRLEDMAKAQQQQQKKKK
ncbi:MAG: membrane protein insertase YidC [Bacteroidales bacterium]